MNPTVLKYCERILRLYFSREDWTPEEVNRVQSWLINGEHCREKDFVLRRIFKEYMAVPIPTEDEEEALERVNYILSL